MKAMRYAVYTALGDGVPREVLETGDPAAALAALASEEARHEHRDHVSGMYDPDDPERGDVRGAAEDAVAGASP